jgi:transcriptional regulator with XRE-family HTH domain
MRARDISAGRASGRDITRKIAELIQAEMVRQNLSSYDLAMKMGVEPSRFNATLWDWWVGDRTATMGKFARMARALGCKLQISLVEEDNANKSD